MTAMVAARARPVSTAPPASTGSSGGKTKPRRAGRGGGGRGGGTARDGRLSAAVRPRGASLNFSSRRPMPCQEGPEAVLAEATHAISFTFLGRPRGPSLCGCPAAGGPDRLRRGRWRQQRRGPRCGRRRPAGGQRGGQLSGGPVGGHAGRPGQRGGGRRARGADGAPPGQR